MDRQIKKAFQQKVSETSFPEHVNIEQLLQRKKKQPKMLRRNIAVASVLFCLISTILGVTFSVYAGSIPMIGDVFKFLKGEESTMHIDYKGHSDAIHVAKESNGIKVTIQEAVYDGKEVLWTYKIESKKDLGETLSVMDKIKIKGIENIGVTNKVEKVDEHMYVGLLRANNVEGVGEEAVSVEWDIDSIQTINEGEIKGDWDFSFTLDAVDQKAQLVNRSTEEAGVKVTIEKLSISPISFILDYKLEFSEAATNIWGEPYVDITIKDDLGNNYIGEDNGGVSEPSSYMKLSKTFGKINNNATKLIVTPHVRTSNSYGAGYSPLFQPSGGYAQLGEIVIELEK
ncbi:DUF4179 domain-containing protein [Bacillus manliponensis]|uniref:DUF4179 domain-containing protein n=1 Tax=Bacillus manliponensis TaxID=574376 RepID=UPI003514304F